MKICLFVLMLLSFVSISAYTQAPEKYTLFVGDFENRTDIVNPLLAYVSDTLGFLFSRSELAEITPVSPSLRNACLQQAQSERPIADVKELALFAAECANADVALVGFFDKTDTEWAIEAQLYIMRKDTPAWEGIRLVGENLYRLLDDLALSVSRRLGTDRYLLLSTQSWEAYESYLWGHQAFSEFDLEKAIVSFKRAIELDPEFAIAQAELGISYMMTGDYKRGRPMFEEALKRLKSVSQPEQLVVSGLESYYEQLRLMHEGNADDMWGALWLHWHIGETTDDPAVRNREYRQWLLLAVAYAKSGFYGPYGLADAGKEKCLAAFNSTGEIQFLNAALRFITQAADLKEDDEYDDSWKYWELASIYDKMERPEDAQSQREQWLKAVKSSPVDRFSPDVLNEYAKRCLMMKASEDALEFAVRAFEMESDPDIRTEYLVTLGDAYMGSAQLAEAFDTYLEAFKSSKHEELNSIALSSVLSGLAQLVSAHSESLDEKRRLGLRQILKSIKDKAPPTFTWQSANSVLYTAEGLKGVRDFCHAMEDMSLLVRLIRGALEEEKSPEDQFVYLSALVTYNGGVSKYERNWLSNPDFIKSIANLNDSMKLGWAYEMTQQRRKAAEVYQRALRSGAVDTAMLAACALIGLQQNLGEATPSRSNIYFEAERAEKLTPYLETANATEASGGSYIWARDTFDGSHNNQGGAEYTFKIEKPGNYRLVARMLGESSYASDIYVSVGDREASLSVGKTNAAWDWRAADKNFALSAGEHCLVVRNKDDGVKLDCMVLYGD